MASQLSICLAFFISLLLAVVAFGQQESNALCQYPSARVLDGCPRNTVLVGQNSTSTIFRTIQNAILSLPNDNTSQTILVLPGNYTEQLNVTRKGPITLLGVTRNPRDQAANMVMVNWNSANGAGSGFNDNAYTSVLTVAPNLNASLTGSGNTGFPVPADTPFGNTDFRAYNIDFRNNFAPRAAGPSLAVSISRANAGFYYCGIYSFQDTVYIGKLGNAFFYGAEIAGQTDFLYGFGTAWIEHSNLTLRGCGGGVIAWKGTNTTSFANKYGCYISNSFLNAANASIAPSMKGKCSLGRPWNAQHRSVYMNTWMDASILPAGYTKWTNNPATNNYNNYTIMAEYGSSGPGFNLTARLAGNVSKELNATTVRPYDSPRDVFMTPNGQQPDVAWIDESMMKC
ncbi:pectin lyase fold/virulence factor [Leptodontidium sp. 2 PMI_412]|nr:pectin lyase fold/virulence factor [Leptodontidium sp. 2 PMI_412]